MLVFSRPHQQLGYIADGFQDLRLTILPAVTHETARGDHDFCLSQSHYFLEEAGEINGPKKKHASISPSLRKLRRRQFLIYAIVNLSRNVHRSEFRQCVLGENNPETAITKNYDRLHRNIVKSVNTAHLTGGGGGGGGSSVGRAHNTW